MKNNRPSDSIASATQVNPVSQSEGSSEKESTRIIVKNLPKYITNEKLKSHFSKHAGSITDVKLMLTKEGVSRRFAYIGYKTSKDAASAARYFNQTFIDTTKIQVELAFSIGDPNLPRPWSKHHQPTNNGTPDIQIIHHDNPTSTESTDASSKASTFKIDALALEFKKRQVLQDYLKASKTKSWANDDVFNVQLEAVPDKKPGGNQLLLRSHIVFENESDDEYQTLPSIRLPEVKIADCRKNISKNSDQNNKLVVAKDAQLNATPITSDTIDHGTEEIRTFSRSQLNEECPALPQITPSFRLPDPEKDLPLIKEYHRLFIINLPYFVTEQDIAQVFQKYGKINHIHIPIHTHTKRGKGIAYLTFVTSKDAIQAYNAMQSQSFQGRIIRIYGASAPPTHDSAKSVRTFKEQRESERKNDAENPISWNPLFMDTNTIAELTAKQLGIRKADFVDPTDDQLAVRLALAETQWIQQAHLFFKAHGIPLHVFNEQERSDHIILAKNLDASVVAGTLKQLFGQYGQLGRVIMPEFGLFALIEFLVPSEARAAFRHLAYKKLGSLPLYLEWAPKTTFSEPFNSEAASDSSLNTVQTHSREKLHSDTLILKKGFKKGEDATDITLSAEEEEIENNDTDSMANVKVLVRNVPFEATIQDLKRLFSAVAQIKRVRLPKKVTGGHRGFAFIEFLTPNEAATAIRTLSFTHLYGRRLVLEYAEQKENISALRAKTKLVGASSMKRRKVEFSDTSDADSDLV